DDCWFAGRDANGRLVENLAVFPSGITNLANYIHSKGLKFGVYLPVIPAACTSVTTPGHEASDAATILSYGTDFLKYDYVNGRPDLVATLWDAIKSGGGNMVLSLSAGSFDTWMPDLGNSWRTSIDYYSSDWTNIIRVLND